MQAYSYGVLLYMPVAVSPPPHTQIIWWGPIAPNMPTEWLITVEAASFLFAVYTVHSRVIHHGEKRYPGAKKGDRAREAKKINLGKLIQLQMSCLLLLHT